MTPTHPRRLAAFPTLAVLAAGLALAACDGGNAFTAPPPIDGDTTGTGTPVRADTTRPLVAVEFPDSGTTVAVGDSVYVRAHATDNAALDSVVFEGFALRGNPDLGTQQAFARFGRKAVALKGLPQSVRDTVLQRYLIALADTSSERDVRIVVTAVDSMGNRRADTTAVNLGGPRVQIASPATGADFQGGLQIPVRVVAEDRADLIRSVRLRATGAFAYDSTLLLRTPAASVDSVVVIPIPATAAGPLQLLATTVSGGNITGTGAPVNVIVRPADVDNVAPRVTFSADVPSRAETDDSLTVAVSGVDNSRVDSVGVTVLALRRGAAGDDTLAVLTRRVAASADSARFGLHQVPLSGLDTVTLTLEVTAWAKDPFGNCGAAVSPQSPQSQACRTGTQGARVSDLAGRQYNVFVARGVTVPFPNPGDVLADLIADDAHGRIFLSNLTRNRVEVLPVGSKSYAAPVRVGSQPWGLAIGRSLDSLYVANSGGTNVSVVPLSGAVLAEAEDRRIFTRNERLFSVLFSGDEVSSVTSFDYSDRPQFIAQASNGLLVYSTRPTSAARDGTVRIYDPRKLRSEIFTGYVDRHSAGKGVVVNADSVFYVDGPKYVMVCPRRRFGDTADPGFCITGPPGTVSDSLTALRQLPPNAAGGRWDTRLDLGADIAEVGLSDTTFVAVSGDRNYIGVGEGVRTNARVPLFQASGDSLNLVGDVRDLISNAAERVIGLGLNYDGSLGVARGGQAYYFSNTARLQGVVSSGSPAGGVAQHPDNAGYPGGSARLSFVSGIDAAGGPYVDVIDNFNFFRVQRIFTRDPVVGALAVARRVAGDPANVALRIYALTPSGVVALQVTNADLVP